MNHAHIAGHGFDADPARRPGVPMEAPPPGVRQGRPPRQNAAPSVHRSGRADRSFPPVFGTAQPPRGLSGALRTFAYRYPTHLKRHWLALLFADRVDVWEHRLGGLPGVATLGALAFTGRYVGKLLQQRAATAP